MSRETQTQGRKVRSDRRIPGWAATILTRLARDRPAVVTRGDLVNAIAETGLSRDVESTARELQRLGWLAPVHVKGAWAYLPPGEDEVTDPYIDLRAWRAREENAVFALAGEAAAWHLGYLDRAWRGPIAVWIPSETRMPHGLRPHVTVVTLGWRREDAADLAPSRRLLHRRGLDLIAWATGLPAFGPEALLVQLAKRPASFRTWADLVSHLDQLAADCDPARLTELLRSQSTSAWQRAAYMLDRGQRHEIAVDILEQRPSRTMPKVQFGNGPQSEWVPEFQVQDRLVAPLQQVAGKA